MLQPERAGATFALARAAAATRWADTPPAVRERANALFTDTLAVIAAGVAHASYRPFVESWTAETGPCTVIGRPSGVSAETAALVNGGATMVLQWQDGHRVARGHPASHLVPTLLALAESGNRPADAVMGAFVAGYEVAVRIGAALGGMHALLHDAGTFATLGAAAAAAHLETSGNADAIAEAIEVAAAVCPMPYRQTVVAGAAVHQLYIGEGARMALTAARAARTGLHALGGTLVDFFGPRAGENFSPAALTDGVGPDGRWTHYQLLDSYFKWWPVCAHMSTAADAAAALISEHGAFGDQVEQAECAIYGYALEYNTVAPANDFAARFSIQAIVATILANGALNPGDFAPARLADPTVRAQMDRVVALHHPAFDTDYPAARPCRLSVRLKDGRVLTAERRKPYGDALNPLTEEDRNAKVRRLMALSYGVLGTDDVLASLNDYLGGGAITALTTALRRSST